MKINRIILKVQIPNPAVKVSLSFDVQLAKPQTATNGEFAKLLTDTATKIREQLPALTEVSLNIVKL